MKVTKIPYEVPEINREIFKVNFNDYHYDSSDPEYIKDQSFLEEIIGRISLKELRITK